MIRSDKAARQKKMSAHEVTGYTHLDCEVYLLVVDSLPQNNVEFTQKDIHTDLDAMQEISQMTSQVTIITIDNEVISFDRQKISEKLEI